MGRRVAPLRTSLVLLHGIHSRKDWWARWSLASDQLNSKRPWRQASGNPGVTPSLPGGKQAVG